MLNSGRERRSFPRKRSRASARIWSPHGSLDCVVVDISSGGAGLLLRREDAVPDAFELELSSGERIAARVVWRALPHCGVVLIRDPE
ncbi:PilZ domain-containing protein [Caulobacter sp. S45]|uniref:PilZ domain-containing protein n=1 Tax=Caulobacter sp. S45 TaxID=1641861 RepID=UPI00131B0557